MTERTNIRKSTRFEVFKRDSFRCVYCGRKAPDVLLHIDHIKPLVDNGTDDLFNLATSCQDCNLGKGAQPLTSNQEVDMQFAELEQLNERREQLELLFQWRSELINLQKTETKKIADEFARLTVFPLIDSGLKELSKWIKKFGAAEVLESLDRYVAHYLGNGTQKEAKKVFDYIPRIAGCRKREKENPQLAALMHCKYILRKNIGDINSVTYNAVPEMQAALDNGVPLEKIKALCYKAQFWKQFMNDLCALQDAVNKQEVTHA